MKCNLTFITNFVSNSLILYACGELKIKAKSVALKRDHNLLSA